MAITQFAEASNLPDPFVPPYPRMEQFFGDVAFELDSSMPRDHPSLVAYRQLIVLYARLLAETTNWLHDRPLGLLGRFLRELIREDAPETVTFLTFNHDLVLENAVIQLPYRQRWCIQRGYGDIELTLGNTDIPGPSLPTHDDDVCDHDIDFKILKLHGSLHWGIETLSHDPTYRDLFPPRARQKTLTCITDREVTTGLGRTRGNRSWRLWPQFVPPVYDKQSIIDARFSGLWAQAAESLSGADRVTLYGYSFPPSDLHAANLIRRGIRSNAKLSEVRIVNPDATLPGRVAELVALDSVVWFRDLSNYTTTLKREKA